MMKTKADITGQLNSRVTDPRGRLAKPAHKSYAEAPPGTKIRILIIEDEPAMVAGLRDNFEYEGFEVISAGDGEAGLERRDPHRGRRLLCRRPHPYRLPGHGPGLPERPERRVHARRSRDAASRG